MTSIFGRDRVMAIESSATSAANLEWYAREMVERDGARHGDPFAVVNLRAGEVTPRADDPYYHPYLYGSRVSSEMRAGFYGVAGWHTEGHLLRALFEGVAFEHRRHIDVLRSAGLRFDSARLSGGGARSTIWPQMFADILGIPISVAQCRETGALGAAIAAGVGAGLFTDLEAGVTAMTRSGTSLSGDRSMRAHYDERYRVFGSIAQAMQPIWRAIADAGRG
jgi:L-xylulokinase